LVATGGCQKSLNSHRSKIKKMAASYLQHNADGTIENNSLGYYYAMRHYFFLQPDKENIYIDDLASNYSSFESILFLSALRMLLDENNFDAQIVIIPSRFGPRAGEAMYGNDFALALLTNDKHIYTARCVFDCPDQLPYYLQGQPPTSLYKSTILITAPATWDIILKVQRQKTICVQKNCLLILTRLNREKLKLIAAPF
jgi:hypothetical protein